MLTRLAWRAVCFLVSVAATFCATATAELFPQYPPKSVRLIAELSLPLPTNAKNAFVDTLTFAPKSHTLYAGYTSENMIVAFDASTNKLVASISDLPNVRAIAIVPELKIGFTCNRLDKSISVVDLKTNASIRKIEIEGEPATILFDSKVKLIYVVDSVGRAGLLIDPETQKIVANIPLGGTPESARADLKTGLIYQILSDTQEVVVIDPIDRSVSKRFKVIGGESPAGLALDSQNRRIFITCENGILLMMDSDSGEIVASSSIGKGADTADYDSKWKRVYTANGRSGTMSVVEERSKNSCSVLEDIETFPEARSLVVDPGTHRIYLSYGDKIAAYAPLKVLQNVHENSSP